MTATLRMKFISYSMIQQRVQNLYSKGHSIVFSKTGQLLSRSDLTGHGLHIKVRAKAKLVGLLINFSATTYLQFKIVYLFFLPWVKHSSNLSNSFKVVDVSRLSPDKSPISFLFLYLFLIPGYSRG